MKWVLILWVTGCTGADDGCVAGDFIQRDADDMGRPFTEQSCYDEAVAWMEQSPGKNLAACVRADQRIEVWRRD